MFSPTLVAEELRTKTGGGDASAAHAPSVVAEEQPMGLLDTMARRGAVGGTARWAVFIYGELKKQDINLDLEGVVTSMLMLRYYNEAEANPSGSAGAILHVMMSMVDQKMVRGLAHLVVLILVAEAGFMENRPRTQRRFVDVIAIELVANDIPLEYAFGEDAVLAHDRSRLLGAFMPAMVALSAGLIHEIPRRAFQA